MFSQGPQVFLVVLCAVLTLAGGTLFGLTPEELYQDGRREFLLGNWSAAIVHLNEFTATWPDHPLVTRGRYMKTLALIRDQNRLEKNLWHARVASLTDDLLAFQTDLPDVDLLEIEVELEGLRAKIAQKSVASVSSLIKLPADRLQQYIKRGWIPENLTPVQTLVWIQQWQKVHNLHNLGELRGNLEYMKAKALWRVFLSPLPLSENRLTLEKWQLWPIKRGLEKSLSLALKYGSFTVQREAALLGVCISGLKRQRVETIKKSKWFKYLQERGIHSKEAWCPE